MAAEQAKHTITEETGQGHHGEVEPSKDTANAATKEERLQPIGASDPKNYNDHNSGGTDANNNKTRGKLCVAHLLTV